MRDNSEPRVATEICFVGLSQYRMSSSIFLNMYAGVTTEWRISTLIIHGLINYFGKRGGDRTYKLSIARSQMVTRSSCLPTE